MDNRIKSSEKDIEKVLKTYIGSRKIITIIDKKGLELTNVVPVKYKDGYLTCTRAGSSTLFEFNSINEIIIIDELSPTTRLFARSDLSSNFISIKIDDNFYQDCKVADYSLSGLGVLVPESFDASNLKNANIVISKLLFPCAIVYFNKKLRRIGVFFEIEVGREFIKRLNLENMK